MTIRNPPPKSCHIDKGKWVNIYVTVVKRNYRIVLAALVAL